MMDRYQIILDYIDEYWDRALSSDYRSRKRSLGTQAMHIGYIPLPYPAVSPNDRYFAHTQFYWDSYFTIIGLVVTGRIEQARNMVDNLCYLFNKFGLVPARNSWTSVGRSQPPFLTRMAFEVYDHGGADEVWLGTVMRVAEQEYYRVWMQQPRFDTSTGLSRYQPRFWKRHLTVYESGWDSSARYTSKNYKTLIPVDLNCQLYQYEVDFARYARLVKDTFAAKKWEQAAQRRRELINQYFWDEERGFYYDYNLKSRHVEPLKTLAGFFPLWCSVASSDQASRCLKQLATFEQPGGLTNTEPVEWKHRQWDYPNGWAPQQYIVYAGLNNYGFTKEALQLARRWLSLNLKVFERTGKLWEKYDVVREHVGWKGRYPTQAGFAWTNGVFIRLLHHLK